MNIVKLSDVCDFESGFAFPSINFSQTSGIGLIRIRDIKDGYKTQVLYNGQYSDKYLVHSGDYLIGMDGEFRCYQWNGEDALLNQRVCRLKADINLLDSRYFFYSINKYLKDIEDVTSFTTVKHISVKQIRNIQFLLPSLEEQGRIVAKLDAAFEKIDQAIELNEINKRNSELLFTNTLEDVFDLCNTGHWKSSAISDLGRVQTGTTPKTLEKANYGDYIPFIKPGDYLGDGTLNYQRDGLSKKGLRSGRLIPANSVLMVCIGATITKVGYCDRDVSCNQQINALSLDNGLMSKFVYYQMTTNRFKSKILNEAPKTTLPIINKGKWSKLILKIPAKNEIEKIVDSLSVLSDKSVNLQKLYLLKSLKLKSLKTSMLHEAFSESAIK